MRRAFGVVLLGCLVAFTAAGTGDVLQQVKVSKKQAVDELQSAFVNGNVNYWPARQAFKAATPAARTALVEQSLLWVKAYVNSPQFATDYAERRAQAKPQAPEYDRTVDQVLADRKKDREADLAKAKANIKEMPAEYRKVAEEGYRAAAEGMKQLDTPEFRKMERQSIEMERQQEQRSYEERLAKWEKAYPADPRQLVKARLQQFLQETANVDYAAKLNGRKFASPAYERNSSEWKLAYRAGKEPTEKARAFAQAWLGELK